MIGNSLGLKKLFGEKVNFLNKKKRFIIFYLKWRKKTQRKNPQQRKARQRQRGKSKQSKNQ